IRGTGRAAGGRPGYRRAVDQQPYRPEAPLVGRVPEAGLHAEVARRDVADRRVDSIAPGELPVESLGGRSPEALALVLGEDPEVDGDHHPELLPADADAVHGAAI